MLLSRHGKAFGVLRTMTFMIYMYKREILGRKENWCLYVCML